MEEMLKDIHRIATVSFQWFPSFFLCFNLFKFEWCWRFKSHKCWGRLDLIVVGEGDCLVAKDKIRFISGFGFELGI